MGQLSATGNDDRLLHATQHKTWQMWLVTAWTDAMKFNLEVQSVVSIRLMKIAAGGASGTAESTRIVGPRPDNGGEQLYRIKSPLEPHEWVAKGSELEKP
jgi:hypothetical protein